MRHSHIINFEYKKSRQLNFTFEGLLKKSTNKLYTEDVYSATRPFIGSVQLKVANVKLGTRTNIELQKKLYK